MAFLLQSFGTVSATMNRPLVQLQSGVWTGANTIYSYHTATDSQATVAGANYFNDLADQVQVGDVIYVSASDANAWYSVTANTGGVVTISAFSLAGPVGTANIEDLAVTTAKIDDLAVTTGKIAAAAVTSAKLDPTTIQYATGTINAASFLGAYATPIQLVAAGGANTLIVLQDFTLELLYGTTQFAAGGAVLVQYDDTANGLGTAATATQAAATFTGAVANTALRLNGVLAPALATAVVNQGLFLSNQTAAFTTGDSTFRYWVRYAVLPSAT